MLVSSSQARPAVPAAEQAGDCQDERYRRLRLAAGRDQAGAEGDRRRAEPASRVLIGPWLWWRWLAGTVLLRPVAGRRAGAGVPEWPGRGALRPRCPST